MNKETFLNTMADYKSQRNELQKQIAEIEENVRKAKQEYANENREFQDNEAVTVIKYGNRMESGVVRGIEQVHDDGKIDYKVAALKTDGTAHGTKRIWVYGNSTIAKRQTTNHA